MFWHLCRRIAFIGSIGGVFRIGVSIRTDYVNTRRQRRFRFDFYATSADLATFNREEGTLRVRHQVVCFSEIIHGTSNYNRTIFRYIFHADFILLTFRRCENITILPNLRRRFKRFAIAEVRCYTIIKQVVNTTTPGKLFVITFIGRPGNAVKRFLICPVITTAQGNQHFIPLRLILNINARLFLLIQNAVRAGVCRIFGIEVEIGIHRIVQIEQWHRVVVTKPGVDVITHTHKVDTGQQGVVDIASGKLALQLGINGEVLQLLIINDVFTCQIMAFIRWR